MTKKTKQCVGCGEPIPSGHLSCPACGELIASVSRAVRRQNATEAQPVSPPTPAYLIDPEAPIISEPEPEWQAPWPPLEEPARVLVARAYGRDPASDAGPDPVVPSPGAYVPPSLTFASATAAAAARPVARSGGAGGATMAVSGAAPAPGTTLGARPAVDAARLIEVAGWFVVVGSAMAVLGFLLPWSEAVIGARGSAGYLDHWGLASPSHMLVIAGLLGVLALGVVRTPVPSWLRTGVLGLGFGGLLVGLTWPYLLGPLGAEIGVLVTGLGGFTLVIGGGVASWAARHEGTDPVV